MVKRIAIAVAVVLVVGIAAVLIAAAGRPDTFHIQRAAIINAPPDKVFPLIAEFRAWDAWSPWEKKDPAMKRSFSGAASGWFSKQ